MNSSNSSTFNFAFNLEGLVTSPLKGLENSALDDLLCHFAVKDAWTKLLCEALYIAWKFRLLKA